MFHLRPFYTKYVDRIYFIQIFHYLPCTVLYTSLIISVTLCECKVPLSASLTARVTAVERNRDGNRGPGKKRQGQPGGGGCTASASAAESTADRNCPPTKCRLRTVPPLAKTRKQPRRRRRTQRRAEKRRSIRRCMRIGALTVV